MAGDLLAMKRPRDLHAVVNGEPCAFTALTSLQGGGFVNREEEGDVATAAMRNSGHPSMRRGNG